MTRAGGERISGQEFATSAHLAADHLANAGVTPADRVVLAVHNGKSLASTFFGLMNLGAGIVLCDPRRGEVSAREFAGDTQAKWLITDTADAGIPAPGPRIIAPVPDAAVTAASLSSAAGSASPSLELRTWRNREDGLLTLTSGTTGAPKIVARSGRSVLDNIARTADRMRYHESDVLAPLLSLSHQYGMSVLLLSWMARCQLLLTPPTRLDFALRQIGEQKATVVDTVPSVYQLILRLIQRLPALPRELESVRMWCVGGSPSSDNLLRQFRRQLGKPLLDGYGSSELGNVALAAGQAPDECTPLDGVRVWIADPAGRPLPPGEIGEVWVDTPDRFGGYLESGSVRHIPDAPYRTGDIGYLNARGSLRVLGRSAAVHRNGYTLYPDHLRARAEQCGGVPVQVVAVTDSDAEAKLVFFVEDLAGGSPADWRHRLEQLLEPHELPNRIVVLTRFPMQTSGKTDIAALQSMARACLARSGRRSLQPASREELAG